MIMADAGVTQLPLVAAFVAGLAGSVHCVAMCGGISAALGLMARRRGLTAGRAVLHSVGNQTGRIGSYALAGAVCGASGGALVTLFDLEPLALAARIAGGILLMAVATRVLFGWQLTAPLERLGARAWTRLVPMLRSLPVQGFGGSVLLGIGWGWMPCGLVYSMLVFAATTGSAARGAATMALFGIGTWPLLLAGSLFSGQLARAGMTRRIHATAGVILLACGAATVAGAVLHSRYCP